MNQNDATCVGQLGVGRYSRENRLRLSGPGLRTFVAIADRWALTEAPRRHLLGSPSRRTYRNWCRRALVHEPITLSIDVLTRISLVLNIHKSLGIPFPGQQETRDWLTTPHDAPPFHGQAPIQIMTLKPDGLISTYRFLVGAQEGLYMRPNSVDASFTPWHDREISIQQD